MRLGVTFGELLTDLRAEIGRSTDLSVGVSDAARLKRALNRIYTSLYDEWDWPHLRRVFEQQPVAAGQRYYDPPEGLNIERIETLTAWWNGSPVPLPRGINNEHYAAFDGAARSDPVSRWDIRYVEAPQAKAMIELWPVPASDAVKLEFTGIAACAPLVNDGDRCLLDAESVLMFAAADVVDDEGKAKKFAAQARARFARVKSRNASTGSIRMGLGQADRFPIGRAVVRVNG